MASIQEWSWEPVYVGMEVENRNSDDNWSYIPYWCITCPLAALSAWLILFPDHQKKNPVYPSEGGA